MGYVSILLLSHIFRNLLPRLRVYPMALLNWVCEAQEDPSTAGVSVSFKDQPLHSFPYLWCPSHHNLKVIAALTWIFFTTSFYVFRALIPPDPQDLCMSPPPPTMFSCLEAKSFLALLPHTAINLSPISCDCIHVMYTLLPSVFCEKIEYIRNRSKKTGSESVKTVFGT